MTDAISLLGASMRADAESVRVISQNVANVQTYGYRREIAVSESAFRSVEQQAQATMLAPTGRIANDFRPGTLQQTSGPWHVAIEGEGYFVLSTPGGERLTRRGDFTLDADSKLVSHEGYGVLGQAGEVTVPDGSPIIDPDGTIRVDGQVVDQLRRVTTAAGTLTATADGLFVVSPTTPPTETTANSIRQGFVETSNVAPVDEILRLMETTRHFETAQHLVRGANDLIGNAITTLGKV